MPPKAPIVLKSVSHLEARLDEITKMMYAFIQGKSGFGEPHVLARTLQNIFKQFDLDHSGELDPAEFKKTLDYMNIDVTEDELYGIFERFDTERDGTMSQKQLSDAIFGLSRCPLGNPEARSIIRKFQEKLMMRAMSSGSDHVVRGLTKALVIMDRNKSGSLCKEELFNGLQRYGIQCTLQDIDVLIKHFDHDKNKEVSLTEFFRAVRGHMPHSRRELVGKAFALIDTNGSGSATLSEIAALFDVTKHPKVLSREKTAEEVYREFMGGWDRDGSGDITFEEFVEYYEDISASIDRDDYFELMMRNAWHLSGGSGSSANTSCRRVLVTYTDGRQSIEEVQNDFGVGTDLQKIRARLEAQGVHNIQKIDLYA